MRILILASAIALIALHVLAPPPPPGGAGGMKRQKGNWTGDPAIFSPSDIDGLQFWFKGDTLSGADGTSISNWQNSASQTAWYATNQTSAQWPFLTNNFNGTGQKALWFDGSNDKLWISNAAAMNVTRNTNDCAIVAVVRVDDNATSKDIIHISTPIAGLPREALAFLTAEDATGVMRSLDGDSTTVRSDPSSTPTMSTVCAYGELVHTNKVSISGSSITIFTNNVQAVTGAGATSTNTADTASGAITISGTGFASHWLGEIAEILVYVPKPSATDRTNIYNYLKAKYALVP